MTPQQREMCKVRDRLIEMWEQHRVACDEPECTWRENTIAYLAHSLGVDVEGLDDVAINLADYNRRCQHKGGVCRN